MLIKTYLCRETGKGGPWQPVKAYSAQEAAEEFSEEWGPEKVTVRGYGKFVVDEIIEYKARKVK